MYNICTRKEEKKYITLKSAQSIKQRQSDSTELVML